jgi:serine/threonine protein kinase
MEEDAHHGGGGARAAPPQASAPVTTIQPRGYSLPPPTFKVKREFAAWDIDHNRFEVKRVLGKGSYGVVAEAFDHLTKQKVAIKKINTIFDVFENSKRIYREVSACPGGGGGCAALSARS